MSAANYKSKEMSVSSCMGVWDSAYAFLAFSSTHIFSKGLSVLYFLTGLPDQSNVCKSQLGSISLFDPLNDKAYMA